MQPISIPIRNALGIKYDVRKGENFPAFPEQLKLERNLRLSDIVRHYGRSRRCLREDDVVDLPVEDLKRIAQLDRSKFVNGWNGKHTRKSYDCLRRSIRRNGITGPCTVSMRLVDDGVMTTLADGNNRIAIAEELGIKKLPCKFFYSDM